MKYLTAEQRRLLRSYIEEHFGDVVDYLTTLPRDNDRYYSVDGVTTVKDASYETRRTATVALVEDMVIRLS